MTPNAKLKKHSQKKVVYGRELVSRHVAPDRAERRRTRSRRAAAQHRSTGVWAAVPSAVGAPPRSSQSWTMRSPTPTPARTPAPALARSPGPQPSDAQESVRKVERATISGG